MGSWKDAWKQFQTQLSPLLAYIWLHQVTPLHLIVLISKMRITALSIPLTINIIFNNYDSLRFKEPKWGITHFQPCICLFSFSFFLIFKDFIYLFLEKGREKERETDINVWLPLTYPLLGTWPSTQACALTGNGTGDPLVSRQAVNPLSHTSQGSAFFFHERERERERERENE